MRERWAAGLSEQSHRQLFELCAGFSFPSACAQKRVRGEQEESSGEVVIKGVTEGGGAQISGAERRLSFSSVKDKEPVCKRKAGGSNGKRRCSSPTPLIVDKKTEQKKGKCLKTGGSMFEQEYGLAQGWISNLPICLKARIYLHSLSSASKTTILKTGLQWRACGDSFLAVIPFLLRL